MKPWENIPSGLLQSLRNPGVERSDLTYEYLEAGTRLVATALSSPMSQTKGHPFLRWLSRKAVIAETENGHAGLQGGDGSFRYRWATHADYVQDLITYVKWQRMRSVLPARSPKAISKALTQPAPSAAIQTITQTNLKGLISNSLFRLQLVALAVVGSSRSTSGSPDFYSEAATLWTGIVETFLERYDLTLRDDASLDELVDILIALGDGIALRELADPTSGNKRKARLRLQGIAAMSLLLALVDDGDQRTIEERTDNLS